MSSLIDSLSAVSPEIVRSLAARLGEPNDLMQRGLQAGAATMLGVIAMRAKEPVFMSQVTNLIADFGVRHPAGPAASHGGDVPSANLEAGTAFLSTLFGANQSAIEKKIAQGTGLGTPSASAALTRAAPLLLGILAPKITGNTLEHVVTEDLPHFVSFVPTGVPEQPRLVSLAASAAVANSRHHRAGVNSGKHWMWQVLVLGAVLIGALVWYANRGA